MTYYQPASRPLLPLPFKIEKAFNRFWSWGYSLADPQVPDLLPGVPRSIAVAPAVLRGGARPRTNCTVLGAWCILAALPAAREVAGLWLDLQVGRGLDKPWSGMDSLVDAGFGEHAPLEEPGVYAVQNWSWLSAAGHVVGPQQSQAGQPLSTGHFRLVTIEERGLLQVREASQRQSGVVYSIASAAQAARWGHVVRAVRLLG